MMTIEENTEKILADFRINSVPVNVTEIAKKVDVLIKRAPSKRFSGLLYRKGNIAFMAISSSEPLVRQRFTIAHELGHFFIHPNKDTFIEFRDNKKNISRGIKEIHANQFAAVLLMPRKFIEKDVKNFKDTGLTGEEIKFLAKKYQVSEEAMNFRLINLNLLANK